MGCVQGVVELDTTEQLRLDVLGPAPNEPLLPKPQPPLPTPLVTPAPGPKITLSVAGVATPALSPEQPPQNILQSHTATQGRLGPGTACRSHTFPPGCQRKIHRPRSCRSPRGQRLEPKRAADMCSRVHSPSLCQQPPPGLQSPCAGWMLITGRCNHKGPMCSLPRGHR